MQQPSGGPGNNNLSAQELWQYLLRMATSSSLSTEVAGQSIENNIDPRFRLPFVVPPREQSQHLQEPLG